MEKFADWIARHRSPCRIFTYAFWFAVMALYTIIDAPFWLIVTMGFGGIFVFLMIIDSAAIASIKKDIEIMNDRCDSNPLLNHIGALMRYRHSETTSIMLQVDYCIALEDLGRSQEAFERLNTINIDSTAAAYVPLKITYYSALYDSCRSLQNMDAAIIWYNKAVQNYNSMKDNADKKRLTDSIKIMHAEIALFNNDVQQALALIQSVKPQNLRQQVYLNMFLARIMLKMGQAEDAKNALQFVVQNGNTLSCVQTAKQMLDEI